MCSLWYTFRMIEQIRNALKEAMRAKDQLRVDTLRGVLAAFTNELVAKGRKPIETLDDAEMLTVLKRLAKQRKDSMEQFEKGGRPELAQKEAAELVIIEAYLPQQASREDIERVAAAKKAELGVDAAGAGKLVGVVLKEFGGNADGGIVKDVVAKLFA